MEKKAIAPEEVIAIGSYLLLAERESLPFGRLSWVEKKQAPRKRKIEPRDPRERKNRARMGR